VIGDPTEGSIVVAARKAALTEEKLAKYKRIKEFPFSSERKMMSVITKSSGATLHAKGAPETILSLSTHIIKNGRKTRLTNDDRKSILKANQEMADSALRVLAIATKPVQEGATQKQAEKGLTFLGLVGMIDPPRKEVKEDIALCKKAGIKVVMVTGDHKNTAVAIAKQLDLGSNGVMALTGEELDRISDSKLREIVQHVSVYARVNPEHKVRIVDALRKKGHIIAMTGDGVNDAPALKKADIGVAMGIKGTDVSKEASDMILRDDNFSTIVKAVEGGRSIYDNIKKFIQYLLSSNVGEVLVVFLAILIGFTDPTTGLIIIPLTAIQLLWINLLTDGLPALALGVDPPAPNIMDRKPRSPREKILSRGTLTEIWLVGVIICIGTLFLFWLNLPSGGVKAVTVAFTAMVVFEMVRVQSVRMKYRIGIFSNPKLIIAMATSILLQLFVIYGPIYQPLSPLAEVFTTTPLFPLDWAWIIAVSSSVMIIMWIKERLFGSEI
jgi:Ca2+-transporting ATPase